jgi:hypothetical protein
MGKMTISTAGTKAYANEQRTMSNEQRMLFKTNPIKPNSPGPQGRGKALLSDNLFSHISTG